jgi:hypothetical protein
MDKDRLANTWSAFQTGACRMQEWFVSIAVKPVGMPSLYFIMTSIISDHVAPVKLK